MPYYETRVSASYDGIEMKKGCILDLFSVGALSSGREMGLMDVKEWRWFLTQAFRSLQMRFSHGPSE